MSKSKGEYVKASDLVSESNKKPNGKKFHLSSKWWIVIITFAIALTFFVLEIVYNYSVSNETIEEFEEATGECELCGVGSLVDDVSETRSLLEQVVDTLSDKFYINSLVSILCPVISTILSVSISVYSDNIYGVSLIDLRNLDNGKRFSLLQMILIPIIILALCIGLFYFNLWITTLALNAISLFYVIYFLCQEIPILTKSRKAISKMIGMPIDEYIHSEDSHINPSPINRRTINTVLTNMIYSDGLEITFKDSLKANDFKTLVTLLNVSSAKIVDSKYGQLLEDPQSTYSAHINNIKSFLDILTTQKVEFDNPADEKDIKALSDALCVLYKSLGKDLMVIYKNELSYITRGITLSFASKEPQGKADSYLENASNYLLVSTLNDNQIWYVQELLNLYIEYNKNFVRYPNYLVFVSLYLYYVSQRETTSEEFKNEINTFIDGQWKSIILSTLYQTDFINPVSSGLFISSILDFYFPLASINRFIWTPVPRKLDITCPFDDTYIFIWFINLLKIRNGNPYIRLLNDITSYVKESYRKGFDYFCKSMRIKRNDTYIENLQKELDGYSSLYLFTVDFIKHMDIVKEKYGEETAKVEMERVAYGTTVSKVEDLYDADSFLENINGVIANNAFYYPYIRNGISCKGLYQYKNNGKFSSITRLNFEKRNFDREIRNVILREFEKYYNTQYDEYLSNGKFDMSYFTYFVTHYHPGKTLRRHSTGKGFEKDQYQYNDGSIKFSAHLSPNSICRYLTSDEIEKMIQDEYDFINGTYTKKRTFTYENNSIYRDKNILINYIYNTYRYVYFEIDYEISFDIDHMFTPLD